MKRVADEVDTTITSHLRRRHYPESQHRSKSKPIKSNTLTFAELSAEMACSLTNDTRSLISLRLKSAQELITSANSSYNSFIELVESSDDTQRPALERLAFPLFTHYFVQLFESGHKTSASEFFEKHSQRFRNSDTASEFDADLKTFAACIAASRSHPTQQLDARYHSKTVITLPPSGHRHLLRHLEHSKDLLLHQTIHKKLVIRIGTASTTTSSSLSVGINSNHINSLNHNHVNSIQNSSTPNVKIKVKQEKDCAATSHTKSSKPTHKQIASTRLMPRVCVYSVDDTTATCATVNTDWTRVAFGFETSDIQLLAVGGCDIRPKGRNTTSIRIELPCEPGPSSNLASIAKEESSSKTILRGHSGPVYDLSFLPESDILLSASEDTTIRGWCTKSGRQLASYTGHQYPIWCVKSSALGIYFASGSMDTTARLWTTNRSYPLRIFAGHSQDVDCLQFHPNTKYLATGSADKTVRLWNVSDGRTVRIFTGHFGPVTALAFSPDGRLLASAGDDLHIKIWDIGSANVVKDLTAHSDQIVDLSFNHDSTLLMSTGGTDKVVKVFDVRPPPLKQEANNNVQGAKEMKSTSYESISFNAKSCVLAARFARHSNSNCIMALAANKNS